MSPDPRAKQQRVDPRLFGQLTSALAQLSARVGHKERNDDDVIRVLEAFHEQLGDLLDRVKRIEEHIVNTGGPLL